jgi:hypothetical protein
LQQKMTLAVAESATRCHFRELKALQVRVFAMA